MRDVRDSRLLFDWGYLHSCGHSFGNEVNAPAKKETTMLDAAIFIVLAIVALLVFSKITSGPWWQGGGSSYSDFD